MDALERRYTKIVKEHDPKLFVERNCHGLLQVLRKHSIAVPYDMNGVKMFNVEERPFYIMAMTDNWTPNGVPVEWGSLPLLKRLRDIDMWNDESEVRNMEKNNEKIEKSKERDQFNKNLDFAHELRPVFAKAFSDVNTANMSKTEKIKSRRK